MKLIKWRRYKAFTVVTFLLMALALCNEQGYAQEKPGTAIQKDISVSGKVTDDKGQPMPGVTVGVQGSPTMTITNASGEYKIIVPGDLSPVLVFSYIGFATQSVAINGKNTIDIQMKQGVEKELEEVAVVGFGAKTKKISLTGAQSTVKVSELLQPVANVSTMLSGRVAGVVGVQRGGEPGASAADIWIRGIATSFGENSKPLILVDGVERDMNTIDPEDIESFTILKDASGTAVYGVRGANGVVFIKTKTGKIGKMQVVFDYNEGVNTFTKIPDMLDGVSYMKLANEAKTTRKEDPQYSQDYIDKTASGIAPLVYPNVDWVSTVFNKVGQTRKANVNVSGGVENAQYYVSLAYFSESGLFKKNDMGQYNSDLRYDRYNVTTKVNLKLSNTTKAEIGIMGYFSNRNAPTATTTDVFGTAMGIPPVVYPVIYSGGLVPGISPDNNNTINPYFRLTRWGYRNDFQNQLYSNLRLTQDLNIITKGLSAWGMFSFDAYNSHNIKRSKDDDTYIVDLSKPFNDDGSLNLNKTHTATQPYLKFEKSNGGNRNFYTEGGFLYDRAFGIHKVSGMFLGYATSATDAFADNITSSIPKRTIGLAGRATYSYDERYFLEFNAGYNGSELFAPANRFGFFPAIGLGWVVSNEKFFEPVKDVVSFLKFRYSHGKSGLGLITSGSRRFAYTTEVVDNASSFEYGKNNTSAPGGIRITDYAVPDMIWSTSLKQDLGFEIKLLNNSLSLTVDFFKEKRTGIFMQRKSDMIAAGFERAAWGNFGAVNNKGVDGTLEYSRRIGKIGLSLRGNITCNQDVLADDDMAPQSYSWMEHVGNNALARYGYIAEGLFKDQKEILESATPVDKSDVFPGDIKYKDMNNDGKINSYDVTKIGRGDVPSLVYGFGFDVSYKGFSVTALFQGIQNADRVISGEGIVPFYKDATNAYAIAEDRWTVDNPRQDAFYPRLAYGSIKNMNNTYASSWWVKDISFLRLKTAQLAYNFPEYIFKRVGIKSSSVYLQGINLLTFSKFKLWDPELNTDNGITYPNVTTLSLGVKLTF